MKTYFIALSMYISLSCFITLADESYKDKIPEKPNIIIVLIDSVPHDYVSCYGYNKPTTPFIDSLAAKGVKYNSYFSASSWTTPSIMSLFTGVSPIRHGVVNSGLKPLTKFATLAGEMAKAGYYTLAVTCNDSASSKQDFHLGFDVFDDYTVRLDVTSNVFSGSELDVMLSLINARVDEKLTNVALRRLRNAPKDKPYFLFLHLFDPHWNYYPKEEYKKIFCDPNYKGEITGQAWGLPSEDIFPHPSDIQQLKDCFSAEIRQSDDAVKQLVDSLKKRGQISDSDLVIIMADHGEEFKEHGGLSHGRHLFEEVIHLPFILYAPAWLPQGVEIDRFVTHLDMIPTLTNLVGTKTPAGLLGSDFISPVFDAKIPETEYIYMQVSLNDRRARPMVAIRDKVSKVIKYLDKEENVAYDLVKDPDEQNPLALDSEPKYQNMYEKLVAWYESETEIANTFTKGDL